MRYGEGGLWLRIYDGIENAKEKARWASEVEVYQNINQFAEKHSFSDLVLNNFWFIFFYYFLASSIVSLAFAMQHLLWRLLFHSTVHQEKIAIKN